MFLTEIWKKVLTFNGENFSSISCDRPSGTTMSTSAADCSLMVVMFGDDILLDSDAIGRPRLIRWFGGRMKLTGLMYVRSGERNVEIIIS